MENLCLRYPGVCEIVFSHLDYKSLLNFRFVSKTTKDRVDSDKTLWTRIINKFTGLDKLSLTVRSPLCEMERTGLLALKENEFGTICPFAL